MLNEKELRAYVTSKFNPCPPYHCGVEFLPAHATYWVELGIRVSDEDDKLPPFEKKANRKAVEHDVDELIKMWREEAIAMGYQLDPL